MSDSWVPIDKAFRKLLPRDRPYTELEAAFCLQLDANENKPVSVAGYANLWQWGIKKVKIFLEKMGVAITYPSDTKNKQNQRGHLKKVEKVILNLGTDQGTDKGQIKEQISFIDINYLKKLRNRSGNRCRNRSGAATYNPLILNPKKESEEKKNLSHERQKFGEYVSLPPGEHLSLTEEFGAARLADLIEDVNLYCARTHGPYKDYVATIRSFDKRDRKKNGNAQAEVKDNPDGRAKEAIREFRRFKDQGLTPEKLEKLKDSLSKKYKIDKGVFE